LAVDVNSGATTCTTNETTNWKSGDRIVIAPAYWSGVDDVLLTADAVGGTLTHAALTRNHWLTTGVTCDIANMTRNVRVFSSATATASDFLFETAATVALEYVGFSVMGNTNRGLRCQTGASGSVDIQYCSFYDCSRTSSWPLWVEASCQNIVFSHNTVSKVKNGVRIESGCTDITVEDMLLLNLTGFGIAVCPESVVTGYTGTVIAEIQGYGIQCPAPNTPYNMDGIIFYECDYPLYFLYAPPQGWTLGGVTIHHSDSPLMLDAPMVDVIFEDLTVFSCYGEDIALDRGQANVQFRNCGFNALPGADPDAGIAFLRIHDFYTYQGSAGGELIFEDCSVGTGVDYTDPAYVGPTGSQPFGTDRLCMNTRVRFRDCQFGALPIPHYQGNWIGGMIVTSQRHDLVQDDNRWWEPAGEGRSDSVILHNTLITERLTPLSASLKLESSRVSINLKTTDTATVSVAVRESVVGDGTDYNGNRLRLVAKASLYAGLATDTVLDTATVASEGAWEALSGSISGMDRDTIIEFVVDGDGDAGWFNVGEWEVSVA
jgi:hypothetical protein